MTEQLSKLKDQASGYLQSDDFKSLLPYLMSGGVGALAGGALTGRRREEKGEGRMGYLGRILRNALITGGLAGGAHYLGSKGLENTVGNLSNDTKALSGSNGDEGPLSTATKNIAFSPITAATAGAGALASTRNNSVIGMGDTADYRTRLITELGGKKSKVTPAWLNTASPDEVAKKISTVAKLDPDKLDEVEKLRRMAGIPSSRLTDNNVGGLLERLGLSKKHAEGTQGMLSRIRRRGMSHLGQSNTRMVGRGALGLAAAAVPSLIGSLITNKSET